MPRVTAEGIIIYGESKLPTKSSHKDTFERLANSTNKVETSDKNSVRVHNNPCATLACVTVHHEDGKLCYNLAYKLNSGETQDKGTSCADPPKLTIEPYSKEIHQESFRQQKLELDQQIENLINSVNESWQGKKMLKEREFRHLTLCVRKQLEIAQSIMNRQNWNPQEVSRILDSSKLGIQRLEEFKCQLPNEDTSSANRRHLSLKTTHLEEFDEEESDFTANIPAEVWDFVAR